MGKAEQGIAENRRSQQLDPLSPIDGVVLGQMLWYARRYDEGIQELRKALDLDQANEQVHIELGHCYASKGLFAMAIAEFEKARSLEDTIAEPLAELGWTYALEGNKAEARKVLGELQERAKRSHVSNYLIAIVYAALGDKDQAFAFLDKAYQYRSWYLSSAKVSPELDTLRSDPRFQNLLSRLGLR